MKGLLIKDFCLMKQRTRFFAVLLLVAVFLGITRYESPLVVGFLTLLIAMFSVSTVNYDEFDNCYCFLMTLPISRRLYVREKYVFSIALGVAAWTAGSLLHCLGGLLHGQQAALIGHLWEASVYMPLSFVLVSLILPFQLKYGAEQGRLVMLVVMGAAVALVWAVVKLAATAGMTPVGLVTALNGMGDREMILGSFLLGAVAVGISYGISIRIMERKEL